MKRTSKHSCQITKSYCHLCLTLPEVPWRKGSWVLMALSASHRSTKQALYVFLPLFTWCCLTLHGTLQLIKVKLRQILSELILTVALCREQKISVFLFQGLQLHIQARNWDAKVAVQFYIRSHSQDMVYLRYKLWSLSPYLVLSKFLLQRTVLTKWF